MRRPHPFGLLLFELLLCGLLGVQTAGGQTSPAPSGPTAGSPVVPSSASASPSPTSAGQPSQITVTADRDAVAKQADTLVRKLTGAPIWTYADDKWLEQWGKPVCPLVAGLTRAQGVFLFERVTSVMKAAGTRLAQAGCAPNLYIVFSPKPAELLKDWRKRNPRMYGDAGRPTVKRFTDTTRPIRAWYGYELVGADGVGSVAGNTTLSIAGGMTASEGMGAGGGLASANVMAMLDSVPQFNNGVASHVTVNQVHDLSTVIIIVDSTRMEGLNWGQLADYIALTSMTNVDLDADVHDAPTILSLFAVPADSRPPGLTIWDVAFLKALYHSNRSAAYQRREVAQMMVNYVKP